MGLSRLASAAAAVAATTIALHAAVLKPAVPVDAIPAILDAFRSHRVVALAEGRHGGDQSYQFRLALIRDPRFATVVNDIVVESGTAQYQDALDRFVRGDDVPLNELRHVWQDTNQTSAVWDYSIYEEFFRAARDINATLPRARQMRVLAGGAPFDWSAVQTPADYQRELVRFSDDHAARVVEDQVLRKGRRALVVYGGGHLGRTSRTSIVGRLEANGTRVFSIGASELVDLSRVDPAAETWTRPALVFLRGTALGAVDRDFWVGGPAQPSHVRPAEQQFDAVLSLGRPLSTPLARYGAALCGDPEYLATRLFRIQLRSSGQEAADVRQACEQQRLR